MLGAPSGRCARASYCYAVTPRNRVYVSYHVDEWYMTYVLMKYNSSYDVIIECVDLANILP